MADQAPNDVQNQQDTVNHENSSVALCAADDKQGYQYDVANDESDHTEGTGQEGDEAPWEHGEGKSCNDGDAQDSSISCGVGVEMLN